MKFGSMLHLCSTGLMFQSIGGVVCQHLCCFGTVSSQIVNQSNNEAGYYGLALGCRNSQLAPTHT